MFSNAKIVKTEWWLNKNDNTDLHGGTYPWPSRVTLQISREINDYDKSERHTYEPKSVLKCLILNVLIEHTIGQTLRILANYQILYSTFSLEEDYGQFWGKIVSPWQEHLKLSFEFVFF